MGGSGRIPPAFRRSAGGIFPWSPSPTCGFDFRLEIYEINVLITRTATERVVKVNRSLSQISASVAAARETASEFRASQAETRAAASSGDAPSAGQPTASTSRVSAAWAP